MKLRTSLLLACILFSFSCAKSTTIASEASSRTDFVLGTQCTITLYENNDNKELFTKLFERLRAIEDTMSANKDGTEIALVNENAGIAPVKISSDTLYVLERALFWAKATDGAFDPTVGPLVKLWGIGTDTARVPEQNEIKEALKLIDYKKVKIEADSMTVFLTDKGMKLDLGAIAKGYAADEMVKILKANASSKAIINLGGNIYAYGEKEKDTPWKIGVQNPYEGRDSYLGIISFQNKTMVTSGPYERYFIKDGKRYHHILNTKTGYPAESGALSVTIVASDSIDADGLSTSVFILGQVKGFELLQKFKGIESVFVNTEDQVFITENLAPHFKLSDTSITLK